ncbi:MAG: tRNA (adenosine(37)-N6)-threonylcarbamoyltransferase complex ATPase subunit type 1 TsaE, partial [Patescibacteria group bacterium]
MDKKVITNNSLETQRLGSKFARKLKAGDIVLLFGNLGAGKTTFVQG